MADVVYFARDMMFTSKIREVARQLGVSVEGARDLDALGRSAPGARLVIVDLRLDDALEALARVRAATAAEAGATAPTTSEPGLEPGPRSGPKTVGFVDHERTDVMDAARAHGCHEVLTKGQFAHGLPRLLGR